MASIYWVSKLRKRTTIFYKKNVMKFYILKKIKITQYDLFTISKEKIEIISIASDLFNTRKK